MDGVAAARAIFVADAPLLALVPATRIFAGVMPKGTPLPAIAITSVSTTVRNIPNPGAEVHVTERVQATVLAADYPTQKAVQKAQGKAVRAHRFQVVPGLSNVTAHCVGTGPDFMNEAASIYLGSEDLRVTYTEAR